MPAESFEMSPGYYSALSNTPFQWRTEEILTRVYFNIRPDQAPRGVAAITGELNAANIPFRLKVLRDEHSYMRCDTAVLYLRRPDVPFAHDPLRSAVVALTSALRPGIPALTKPLAPGVGLAEDPGAPGESYGQHRCRLIAEGLLQAREAGVSAHDERLAEVVRVFTSHQVDTAQPFLRAGSLDDYEVLCRTQESAQPVALTTKGVKANDGVAVMSQSPPSASELVATAADIGRRLVDEAIWDGDQCTWLGPVVTTNEDGASTLAYGTIGTTLYDGDSGVALFLAALGSVAGDSRAEDTARGAARHALAAARQASAGETSLYTGSLSIALSAAAVAGITSDAQLASGVRTLLDTLLGQDLGPRGFDLLSGTAGVIVGLLTLAELLKDDGLADGAVRAGRQLLLMAQRSDVGWSWRDPAGARHPNLTGLSHGVAGAGYALLELLRVTGEHRWQAAAEMAFRYEEHWFSEKIGNWPDLRYHGSRTSRRTRTFLTQWCHGAPGIALTRLRAVELTGDDKRRQEALVALCTTVRDTRAALQDRSLSFSLCHGLAGNADVVLDGTEALQDAGISTSSLVADVALAGHDRHQSGCEPWPCGIPVAGRETPGLMLGLAGIGYHYLRQADPQLVPSVLLFRPERFAAGISALAERAASPVSSPPPSGASSRIARVE
jgi:hypothetical protein